MNWPSRRRFRKERTVHAEAGTGAGGGHRGSPDARYSGDGVCTAEIKMAITGNGRASKEQVADMLKRMLHIPDSEMGPFMDATDALGAAYCHYLQMGRPEMPKAYSSWKDFIAKNPERIKNRRKEI